MKFIKYNLIQKILTETMDGVSIVISSATRHSLFRYLYGPHQTFKQLIHNESTTLRNSCAHNFELGFAICPKTFDLHHSCRHSLGNSELTT